MLPVVVGEAPVVTVDEVPFVIVGAAPNTIGKAPTVRVDENPVVTAGMTPDCYSMGCPQLLQLVMSYC